MEAITLKVIMGSYLPSAKLPWIETPLVESKALSLLADCRIFLKLELLQPAGSFKSRAIGNLILDHVQRSSFMHDQPLHFYSSSGGNAGLACVTAATSLGHKASVVVPLTTKPSMIAKIKAAGATDVIQVGKSWHYADAHLRDHVLNSSQRVKHQNEQAIYVPPFDDPLVWQGASTLVDELHHQLSAYTTSGPLSPPDAIILSVGGGGLFSGVMIGLDQLGWSHVPVLAMETRGADSLNQALRAGKLTTLPEITSIAKSLGASRVAERAFEYASQRSSVRSVVLDDHDAIRGVCRLADLERLLVEPACGVCIAVCEKTRLKKLVDGLGPESKVVVIVCGGSDVSVEMVAQWKKEESES